MSANRFAFDISVYPKGLGSKVSVAG